VLSVVVLNAIMLSVVAPKSHLPHQRRNLLAVLCPGDDVIKLFVFVTDAPDSGFVPGKSFEPSPIFVGWPICYKEESPDASLLKKSSCSAPTLCVTKFIIVKDVNLVTLCCAT
jgi:hypothetical protein